MNCPSCGGGNDEDATFCFTCGMALAVLTRGTILVGRYEIQKPLGRGGMGTVYRALDRTLNEPVAIKILRADRSQSSDTARRFLSEIKLARQVSHRNVCRIHEYGEQDGMRFISMELVEGIDLKQLIQTRGTLPPDEAFEVAIQLALGLTAIHEVGIVHRDLKTPNIMRDARGVVRVMDFGIARKMGAEATGGTHTGAVVGTPEYMSPEQAQGQKVDLRSDVYSLGVVIFEIFTGDVPFRGATPVATLFNHVETPPPLDEPRAARIPRSLVPVLRKALAKDPERRFAHAGEMVEALRQARATAGSGASTPVEGALAPDGARPGRTDLTTNTMTTRAGAKTSSRARSLTLVIGIVALGVGAGVSVRRAPPEATPATLAAAPTGGTSSTPWPLPSESTLSTLPPVPTPSEWPPRASPRPAPASARVVVHRPEVSPSPAGRAPVAPLVAAREPAPLLSSEPTPIPPPLPEPAAAPPTTLVTPSTPVAAIEPASGVLQLVVVPFAEASVDGEPLGRVASSKFSLPAGSHRIELTHPDYRPLRRTVTILPGETARLVVDLAEEAVRRKK